jgi:hypothetical protein
MTQNNLGIALRDQGIRTGGAQSTELLAQAVAAYRSALEVYTRGQLLWSLGHDPEQPGHLCRKRFTLDGLRAVANAAGKSRGP